ncbi:MAG: carbohydrate kinase family protein [Anaerolineales bacterium]|nr:carbohydrate kinase family protein [Anaerolineales bacterium]
MSQILVCGLINIETTLHVDGFPIDYAPVRYPFFGVNSSVSGVGFNVAKALTTLGDQVRFLSLIGQDAAGKLAQAALQESAIPAGWVLPRLSHTAQSVITYDRTGRRAIHLDLKDIQEQTYPPEQFALALRGDGSLPPCDLAVLCNINFSRPFLQQARREGIPIATDVHAIADLDDDYNRDFMQAANILFMSDENLPCSAQDWARRIFNRCGAEIVVVGLGQQGALLALRNGNMEHIPAARTRQVVNTIGAGDALFSCFVHAYQQSGDACQAMRQAVVFASYKVGATGAAEGFLHQAGLAQWMKEVA